MSLNAWWVSIVSIKFNCIQLIVLENNDSKRRWLLDRVGMADFMDRMPIPRSYNTVARLRQTKTVCPRSQSSEITGTLYNRSFIDQRTVDIRLRLSIRESTVLTNEYILYRWRSTGIRVHLLIWKITISIFERTLIPMKIDWYTNDFLEQSIWMHSASRKTARCTGVFINKYQISYEHTLM